MERYGPGRHSVDVDHSSPGREVDPVAVGAILLYYSDLVIYEPRLLQMYDEVLPKIDRALGAQSR